MVAESICAENWTSKWSDRKPIDVRCEAGNGLLSGMIYKGHPVDNDNVKKFPRVNSIFKRYIDEHK